MTSLRVHSLHLMALAMLAGAPAVVSAQQPTPPAAPAAAPPASGAPIAPRTRRTVEIRAQAPAPEVITVRPREVPAYTRRLLVPALLTPTDSAGTGGARVVAPAPASAAARAAATSDQRTRTP
jgi:hypothetical protein